MPFTFTVLETEGSQHLTFVLKVETYGRFVAYDKRVVSDMNTGLTEGVKSFLLTNGPIVLILTYG
jgi:hypothetical protein